jgi:hypothetical protein
MPYKDKYLKYKNKYLNLKKYIGGSKMEGKDSECLICLEKYNNNNIKPVLLHYINSDNKLENAHFICLECYDKMTKKECPSCRDPIINPKKYDFNEQTGELVEPTHEESLPAIVEEPIDLTEYYENLWSRDDNYNSDDDDYNIDNDDDYNIDDEEDNIPTVGLIGSSYTGPGPLTRSLMNRNNSNSNNRPLGGFTNNSNDDYDYNSDNYDDYNSDNEEDNIPTVGLIGSSYTGPGPLARSLMNGNSGFTNNSNSNNRPFSGFTNNSNSNNRPLGGFTNNSNYDYDYDYEDNIPTVGLIGSSYSGPGPLARSLMNGNSGFTNNRPTVGLIGSTNTNNRPTGGFTNNTNSNNRPFGGFINNSNNRPTGGFF